ncbi:uncharacterized protein LOC122277394 [Carya illinoinensis]|uniref:uncharacterized protein LOC122277394 n=1 Tax=Carya illinoinensis TaxID=32201 RepID=UPI001C719B9E|nr:uncharacterized protein LOC122277394 [Carya illinoinensis]
MAIKCLRSRLLFRFLDHREMEELGAIQRHLGRSPLLETVVTNPKGSAISIAGGYWCTYNSRLTSRISSNGNNESYGNGNCRNRGYGNGSCRNRGYGNGKLRKRKLWK